MEKININNFEENLFYEKLDTGLEVYMIPLPYKKSHFAFFGTKFGGIDLEFKLNGKLVKVPSGVAHFLEHKLFEQDESPFEFYGKTGTDVNASTSFNYTGYYFTGNNSFYPNLRYLLNWITNFHITDEQVQKEKGIILEEARMYLDNPDRVLYEKIKENTLFNSNYGKKVIGSLDEIKSITKEDLYLCYKSFYTPNNMFILITGDFNPDKTINIIKEELKDFKNTGDTVTKIQNDEPDGVKKASDVLKFPVENTKIAISYKMNKSLFDIDKYYLDYYLQMILSLHFGSSSSFREYLLNKELFISFGYNITDIGTHYLIEFYISTKKEKELIDELTSYISNIKNVKLNEDDFVRLKKTWIASEVRMIDNTNATLYNMLDDILEYNTYKYNSISDKRSLDFNTMIRVLNELDFSNRAILIIKND